MWTVRKRTSWQERVKYRIWTASSEIGTYRLCEQGRFRRDWASAQSRQNLRCSLIQAVSQEEPTDRKPDPWPLWMAGHAQLKFVMTECSKTQIRLAGLIYMTRMAMFKHKNINNNMSRLCRILNVVIFTSFYCYSFFFIVKKYMYLILFQIAMLFVFYKHAEFNTSCQHRAR